MIGEPELAFSNARWRLLMAPPVHLVIIVIVIVVIIFCQVSSPGRSMIRHSCFLRESQRLLFRPLGGATWLLLHLIVIAKLIIFQ